MSESPTWYDLLGVERDASDVEIRAAWRSGTADLEPGDRRFDTLNRAARVLLDPASRREYDAGLPETETETGPEPAPETRVDAPAAGRPAGEAHPPAGVVSGVPVWMLAALGALALLMVVATTWLWRAGDEGSEEAAREAQGAAERAVVPVLSYGFETLEEDQERAQSYLTSSYREDYDELFAVIEENAPSTRTQVGAEVIASGIVRAGEDRVEVLVFVDRPTTNKTTPQPTVYKDQVTMTMERVGDEWLVDNMVTSPVQG